MKPKQIFLFFFCLCVFINSAQLFGAALTGGDTCAINDDCQHAILIPNVLSDQSFVCIGGCNLYASPDSLTTACQMGDFPTVWYEVNLDAIAAVMNIEVHSNEFESPVISVFKSNAGCEFLEQVFLANSNVSCIIGSDGVAKAIGTPVEMGGTYYIAVSSMFSIGGAFNLCVSALSTGSACVKERNIEITARSNGGPLEGPFDPNEKLSICMNVVDFTAAGNGCQWFQGIVPVFGNGWSLSSFDSLGQPSNVMINDTTAGSVGNGLYGASTWDWFNDVDYHYDQSSLNIGDFDGNGRLDMCNSVYEVDCPHKGVIGGCCGPCWGDTLGEILPGGWFAYGINGTCPDPGPPIRVDWGDGNTCGAKMGPWKFCFDLTTRDAPDCLGDSTRRDLSLGFFTFSDGETGSWTGSATVCAYDQPVKLTLKAKCGRVSTRNPETLPNLCSGDTLEYLLDEPNISHWEWNISPFWAVPYLPNQGENGFTIVAPLINLSGKPVDITGNLIGHESGSTDIVLKKFKFKLLDTETCNIVSVDHPNSTNDGRYHKIKIYPTPASDYATLEWYFNLTSDAFISIYTTDGVKVKQIAVTPNDGHTKQIYTGSLSPGIYTVSLSNTAFNYMTKLVRL
jgi:hypothetical protein